MNKMQLSESFVIIVSRKPNDKMAAHWLSIVYLQHQKCDEKKNNVPHFILFIFLGSRHLVYRVLCSVYSSWLLLCLSLALWGCMVQVYSSLISWYFKSYLTLVGIFNLVSNWLILIIISLIGWYYQSFLSLAELINPISY